MLLGFVFLLEGRLVEDLKYITQSDRVYRVTGYKLSDL